MSIIVKCNMCKIKYSVPATQAQIQKWRDGEYIQNAMPNLTADERELLISQTCGKCFDKLFPPEDD